MKSSAVMNHDRTHRYELWRSWDESKPTIMFIGLNPSRADETFNDPTITRCINFAKSWGYGSMFFGNLFSLRSPDPKQVEKDTKAARTISTDMRLCGMRDASETHVLCWGSWKFIEEREQQVVEMFPDAKCFGLNQDGHPKHPLYLKASSELYDYQELVNQMVVSGITRI